MKKVFEKAKILIVILLVILVSIVAFWGVFKKENGIWKNLIPNYNYGMDIEGARELAYALDTTEEEKYVYVDEEGNVKGEVWKDGSATTEDADAESETTETDGEDISYSKETKTVKVNNDENLTKENFETAKKIIQKRLNSQDLGEYDIRIDDVTGKLVIENANDEEEVDLINEVVTNVGKFQVIDYQNGLILMDNSDIKDVSVVYSNADSTYNTYLQIEFNKEGAEKLREMSTKYVETTIETEEEDSENTEETADETEEDEEEPETEIKYVSIVFDDTTLMTTYFGEEMTNGIIQISVGQARTEYSEFLEDHEDAKLIADTLNSGILPIKYELETDNFVKSSITENVLRIIIIVAVAIFAVISIVYIIKYRKNGVIAAVLNIGYIAILSLVCRYTNVEITVTSMVAGFLVIIMNYIFVNNYLKELKNSEIDEQVYGKVSKKFYLAIIPVIVVAIVFTFMQSYVINSIGMIVFWGLILNILYNIIFTKTLIKRKD